MRKFLLIIVALIALGVHAENLSFLGIPIDGTIGSFQSKLLPKGFKLLKTENDGRMYSGNFFSNPVNVYVFYDPKIKTVYSVMVIFPDKKVETNRAFYDNLRESLSEKYVLVDEGKESKYTRAYGSTEFRNSKFLYGNNDEVIGGIDLSEESQLIDHYCTLVYYDIKNLRRHNQSDISDL